MRRRVGALEVFGLRPFRRGLEQCWHAIAGDGHTPPSQFGPSSLRILRPRIAIPLWLGRTRPDGRCHVFNLPNRNPPPRDAGYSVRVTTCRDYRGGQLTYDSHIGTDFAVPVGTEVVATAPGVVSNVRNDMQRGGLKVAIDHGSGVITSSNHLARPLVRPGQRVARGEVIGLSGMSSIDGILFSPWLAPHVHFNVTLDGLPVDPWATEDEVSLWRTRNDPTPHRGPPDTGLEPTRWDMNAVDRTIASCRDPGARAALQAIDDPDRRAVMLVLDRMVRHQTFDVWGPLCEPRHPRTPMLDLPFKAEDFVGTVFAEG